MQKLTLRAHCVHFDQPIEKKGKVHKEKDLRARLLSQLYVRGREQYDIRV